MCINKSATHSLALLQEVRSGQPAASFAVDCFQWMWTKHLHALRQMFRKNYEVIYSWWRVPSLSHSLHCWQENDLFCFFIRFFFLSSQSHILSKCPVLSLYFHPIINGTLSRWHKNVCHKKKKIIQKLMWYIVLGAECRVSYGQISVSLTPLVFLLTSQFWQKKKETVEIISCPTLAVISWHQPRRFTMPDGESHSYFCTWIHSK